MKNNYKKKRILLFVLSAILCTVLAFGVAGCSCGNGSEQAEGINVAPEITVDDQGIYWAGVADASKYSYKINDGAWQDAVEKISFPVTEGDYTLSLKSLDNNGKDGKITEMKFSVEKLTVKCSQVDNKILFEGDNIYYSVNNGDEGKVNESKTLDFSIATVGDEYSVSYYNKGEFWSKEQSTYYLSSEKQTYKLTVKSALNSPLLQLNNEGNGITWSSVANASKYSVSVDDKIVETTEKSVSFSTEIGKHKIIVKALTDNSNYVSSKASEFDYEVKRESVPQITYDEVLNKITFDESYLGKMYQSTDGTNYTAVNGTSIDAKAGLKLKVKSYFDDKTNDLYLESKSIKIEQRVINSIKFSLDGFIKWNENDTGTAKSYYVSIVEDGEEHAYNLGNNNSKNVSSFGVGSYTLSVYGAEYVSELENEVVFYLPSTAQSIDFSVLDKPELSYEGNKLMWVVDNNASGYEVRKSGETTWKPATNVGYYEATEMTTYEVRAVGSETNNKYSLTSSTSSMFFDPTLTSELGKNMLANFDSLEYSNIVGKATGANATATGIVEVLSAANSPEGANGGVLKVTAGNAAPRMSAHWGNSDGMSIQLFKPFDFELGGKIVFRVYVETSAERKTACLYNLQGEPVNIKGRSMDAKGNVFAFVEGDKPIAYITSESIAVKPDGSSFVAGDIIKGKAIKSATYNSAARMLAITYADGTSEMLIRKAYGVLSNTDVLLGVANDKGEVKNGSTLVGTINANREVVAPNGTVLSTQTQYMTQDLSGNFSIGASGSKKTGSGNTTQWTWYNAKNIQPPEEGKWVTVELELNKNYADNLSNIDGLSMHFLNNAKEGDVFYIDEIYYEYETEPTFLAQNGIGPSSYETGGSTQAVESVGTDANGKYLQFVWSTSSSWGVDAVTFNFEDITLNAGDNVMLYTYCPSGTRWPEVWVDGVKVTYLTQEGSGGADKNSDGIDNRAVFTATEDGTVFNKLVIRPQKFGAGFNFSIKVYGVYVLRAN